MYIQSPLKPGFFYYFFMTSREENSRVELRKKFNEPRIILALMPNTYILVAYIYACANAISKTLKEIMPLFVESIL